MAAKGIMKVILIAAMSKDGFIAPKGKEGEKSTEWTSPEDRHYFWNTSKAVGTIVMGRKTYQTIGKPLPKRLNIVMTSDPERAEEKAKQDLGVEFLPDNLRFMKGTAKEILENLEAEGIKELMICGGAEVYRQFLEANLVDELIITEEAVELKDGIRLFESSLEEATAGMELIEERILNEIGTKLIRFRVN